MKSVFTIVKEVGILLIAVLHRWREWQCLWRIQLCYWCWSCSNCFEW